MKRQWRVPFRSFGRKIAHLIEPDVAITNTLCAPALVINSALASEPRGAKRCATCRKLAEAQK